MFWLSDNIMGYYYGYTLYLCIFSVYFFILTDLFTIIFKLCNKDDVS